MEKLLHLEAFTGKILFVAAPLPGGIVGAIYYFSAFFRWDTLSFAIVFVCNDVCISLETSHFASWYSRAFNKRTTHLLIEFDNQNI